MFLFEVGTLCSGGVYPFKGEINNNSSSFQKHQRHTSFNVNIKILTRSKDKKQIQYSLLLTCNFGGILPKPEI